MSYTHTGWESDSAQQETAFTSLSLKRPDWSGSTTVVKNTVNEAIISNTAGSFEAATTYRFARSNISNIYSGAKTPKLTNAVNSKGVRVLLQLNDFLIYTDAEQQPDKIWLPISAHMVLNVPLAVSDPGTIARDLATKLAGLMGQDSSPNPLMSRMNELLRGNLLPRELR